MYISDYNIATIVFTYMLIMGKAGILANAVDMK